MEISKLQVYIVCSFIALFAVGYKVIAPHEGNFYRSVVALTISRWFNLTLCNAALAFLLACFWITVRIFFEKLHPLESSFLQERFLVFAAEGVLGVAMVRGTVTATDGVMFLITCAVSMVHAVLVKRMNMLEESAMTTNKRRIISVSILAAWLFVIDCSVCLWLSSMVWGSSAKDSASSSSSSRAHHHQHHNNNNTALFGRSAGVVLLLLLEWCLNIMQCITATTKLALLAFAARFPSEITNSVRFYVEIVTEITKSVIYIGFGGMLLNQSTMPLHLVREILSNFKRIAILAKDFVQHRKRMKWIEQVDIPTEEQLNEDRFCNICRDEVVNPNSSRILPCSHLFHVDCLAKWLERNRDCPYCQRDVEVMINQYMAAKKRNEQGSAHNSQQQQQGTSNNNNNNNNNTQTAGGDNNNNNNNNNQQATVVRRVRIDRNTGRIADEDVLREMYEQYRAVALKRKEQEAQLRATASEIVKLAKLGEEASAAAAAASSSGQKNSNSSAKKNNNDDDDDDEEFSVAPSASSSLINSSNKNNQNSNNSNTNSNDSTTAMLELQAYKRYERAVSKAKKQLKKELEEISMMAGSNNNNNNRSTSRSPTTPTPTTILSSTSSLPPASVAVVPESKKVESTSDSKPESAEKLFAISSASSSFQASSKIQEEQKQTDQNQDDDAANQPEQAKHTTDDDALTVESPSKQDEKEKEKDPQPVIKDETKTTSTTTPAPTALHQEEEEKESSPVADQQEQQQSSFLDSSASLQITPSESIRQLREQRYRMQREQSLNSNSNNNSNSGDVGASTTSLPASPQQQQQQQQRADDDESLNKKEE